MKIITEADKVKQKALNKPSRAINLGNMESEFGATEQSYVQNIIDQHRAKLNMHSYDRDIEEPRLRDSLVKAGVLLADKAGNVVRDARITPKEERKPATVTPVPRRATWCRHGGPRPVRL